MSATRGGRCISRPSRCSLDVVHVARHVDRTASIVPHGVDRTNAVVRRTTINARRDDADVPTSAAVEAGRAEVFLGDPGRASDVSEGTGVSC